MLNSKEGLSKGKNSDTEMTQLKKSSGKEERE